MFPNDKYEALALLYLQNQNLLDKSPAEILAMFEKAYKEMSGKDSNSKGGYNPVVGDF